jgi:hypothetical protein
MLSRRLLTTSLLAGSADGVSIFYREAGAPGAPVVLLLDIHSAVVGGRSLAL